MLTGESVGRFLRLLIINILDAILPFTSILACFDASKSRKMTTRVVLPYVYSIFIDSVDYTYGSLEELFLVCLSALKFGGINLVCGFLLLYGDVSSSSWFPSALLFAGFWLN